LLLIEISLQYYYRFDERNFLMRTKVTEVILRYALKEKQNCGVCPLWKEKQLSAQDRVRTGDSWLIRPVL
jgi:hypothetical protein